jgi:Pregnancy-associated plasma protein-A/Secretion system C-terminal sorting domain/Fibronectin type III domain
MKKIITLSIALLALGQVHAQRICGAVDHQHALETADPSIAINRQAIEQFTNTFIAQNKQTRATITIPVVVHVLYNNATQNISDAQIASQIAVLNADFARANADYLNTPAVFSSLVGIPDIQFCMAQRDPNGAATTGIIRKSTTTASFSTNDGIKSATSATAGGSNAWNTSQYLNIWVGNISGGILGYAQFPGGPASKDGVVINYTAFGNMGTAAAPYNKGRTATHEVGHWLNLNHIWGDDGTACTGTDNVGDTPNQGGENYGTPTFPRVSCSNGPNGDLFMNYMDYTDDIAMFMFSTGQVSRMRALFATGGARVSLTTSLGCQAPTGGSVCGVPAGLGSASITQTAANLSWGAVSGATGYTVQYKTTSATAYTTVNVTGTSYALSGLTASTGYNWQVSATCASGISAYAAATFTTASTTTTCTDIYEANETRTVAKAMAVNTNITAIISSATDKDWFKFSNTTATKNIKINLTNLPADYDVTLYKSSTQVGISQLASTAAEQIKYNNGTVTTYYVNVYGYGGVFSANCYTLRASLSATAWRTNGINPDAEVEQNINLDKIQGGLDVSVYPNPSKGAFTIDILNIANEPNADIKIIDVTGKLVYSQSIEIRNGLNSVNMNQQLPNGLYQIIVRTGENVSVQKLLKQGE